MNKTGESKKRKNRGRRRRQRKPRNVRVVKASKVKVPRPSGLTTYGQQFLQSVLAPYDFAQTGCGGVPDEFNGPTFTVMQRQMFNVLASKSGDTYYAILPTPQIAYWSTVTSGSPTVFAAVPFDDQSIFSNTGSVSQVVDSMRVIGMSVEFKCNSPRVSTSGSISISRSEIRIEDASYERTSSPETANPGNKTIAGLAPAAKGITSAANYTGNAIDGAFAVARHVGPWSFSNGLAIFPVDGKPANGIIVPDTVVPTNDGRLEVQPGVVANIGTLNWFDNNMEALMVRIPTASDNGSIPSLTMEVIMTVECRPALNTVLAKIAAPSPIPDPQAMLLYQMLCHNMPIAVPAKANANWWQTLFTLLKSGGYVASHVPGPIGLAGKGLETMVEGFEQLVL